jgi:hypothetical protein
MVADSKPVTAFEFRKYTQQSEFFFNLLQQQIISLDVTCGLLMERFGSDWTPAQVTEFKAEVGRRVKAIADDMVAKQKATEKKVHLV